ncbi:MAG: hypothetical protein ACRDL7_05760, partial [Gaiellaceae bacterium]
MTNVPIVKAGTAYDDPYNGITYILVLNQALYFGEKLENTLLCPNQMRANGLVVDDVPRHLSEGQKSTHSIYIPHEKIRINLCMHGCLSYIPTRTPTIQEIENCRWLVMTDDKDWDPYSPTFAEQEEVLMERDVDLSPIERERVINGFESNEVSSVLSAVSSSLCDDNMIRLLEKKVMIRKIGVAETDKRKTVIEKADLSRRWGIGLETAARTLKVTTQKCVRNALHPLHRRYRTRQMQLRYNQLSSRFYSDTLYSKYTSVRNNTCGQVFVNDMEFVRFIPMQSKSAAGDALAEFIQDVGIPSTLHTDNAKEETLGRWRDIRLNCQIKQTETEPYSPWQNRAERTIREIKKTVIRLMTRTRMPKSLWDFCMSYVCDTRCLTAHGIYSLHDRTPYELVTGDTPDISEFVEFDWYQPIWYYESTDFPNDRRLMGRWLGVSHRIGQAMCYWVLPRSGVP